MWIRFPPGQRVCPSAHHRETFPNSRARRGYVTGRVSDGPIRTVQWDELLEPQRLHIDFLAVDAEEGDQPLTEDKSADMHLGLP